MDLRWERLIEIVITRCDRQRQLPRRRFSHLKKRASPSDRWGNSSGVGQHKSAIILVCVGISAARRLEQFVACRNNSAHGSQDVAMGMHATNEFCGVTELGFRHLRLCTVVSGPVASPKHTTGFSGDRCRCRLNSKSGQRPGVIVNAVC